MKLIIIGIVILALFLLLRFFVCKFFYKCTLLNDILKENVQGKMTYSQGRVYLLLSIICYYVVLGVLSSKGLKPDVGFDVKTLQIIIDALQWVILLMAGYVFGSKGLEVVKFLMELKQKTNNSNDSEKNGQI